MEAWFTLCRDFHRSPKALRGLEDSSVFPPANTQGGERHPPLKTVGTRAAPWGHWGSENMYLASGLPEESGTHTTRPYQGNDGPWVCRALFFFEMLGSSGVLCSALLF